MTSTLEIHKRGTPFKTADMLEPSSSKSKARARNARAQFNTPEQILSWSKSIGDYDWLIGQQQLNHRSYLVKDHIKEGQSMTASNPLVNCTNYLDLPGIWDSSNKQRLSGVNQTVDHNRNLGTPLQIAPLGGEQISVISQQRGSETFKFCRHDPPLVGTWAGLAETTNLVLQIDVPHHHQPIPNFVGDMLGIITWWNRVKKRLAGGIHWAHLSLGVGRRGLSCLSPPYTKCSECLSSLEPRTTSLFRGIWWPLALCQKGWRFAPKCCEKVELRNGKYTTGTWGSMTKSPNVFCPICSIFPCSFDTKWHVGKPNEAPARRVHRPPRMMLLRARHGDWQEDATSGHDFGWDMGCDLAKYSMKRRTN